MTQVLGARFLALLEQHRPGLYKRWMGVWRAPLLVFDRFRVIALAGGRVLGDEVAYRKPWIPCLASDQPVFTDDPLTQAFARRVVPLFQVANGLRLEREALHLFHRDHPVATLWCEPMPYLVVAR
jgi:hypothetical protein